MFFVCLCTSSMVNSHPIILLFETDRFYRELVQKRLKKGGVDVSTLRSTEINFNRITEIMPCLILIDLSTALGHNHSIIVKLKEDQRTATIPIIAFVSDVLSFTKKRTLENHGVHCLEKPLDFKKLQARIRQATKQVASY